MEIKVEKLPKSEVKITVVMTPEEMKKYENLAAEQISKEIKMDGFRPGKVPLEMVKSKVGEVSFEAHTAELALPEAYAEAVIKNKLEVVAHPRINILKNAPLSFEATVAVLPEIKLKDYTTIKVKKTEVKIEDKDINEVLESLQRREATFKDVEREAKKGDRVEIDFKGLDKDGKEIPNTASKNHPVLIGDGALIPGFEDGLIGMKKTEKKSLKLKFPKKYHAKELEGADVTFEVTMNRIEEREMPAIDDQLAIKISAGSTKTLVQLKEDIKKNLVEIREEDARRAREDEFLGKIADMTEAELPEAMIEEEINFMLERSKKNMGAQGQDFDKFIEDQKAKGKDLRKDLRGNAEKQIKLRLALKEVYVREKVEATEADMNAEVQKILATYPEKYHDEIKKMYAKSSEGYRIMENQIRLNKVLDKYLK
ncbi:MAG: Trigger factor [uncultured bacterium]|nr:MAG: Trigger factor [uncultured bacterium]OGJ47492.1 MAG: trigger factor [Candidatus Peregrinibacteria bacterium RIFOXYA2_FULL_41_18]OGJ49161.1 MAG: trigger factor [Candidatus Peregrinibacteria bacterium RIFOXYB12_FULL_41_12]OGJ53693.1 MAG: trigger factor [Candidatus Peregrinibacteria bacterium RIFOXYC2_FULL_41_22]OGJ54527.1 MAG: trigger factor [Candidatus Peregrinibacteria bacterium RIFOXYB2_FULL_41_88]